MAGGSASTVSLEASVADVAAARRFVRRSLAAAEVPPSVSDDLQLIVSELFTNAVEHGDNGHVDVTVLRGPRFAGVRVVSTGAAHDVAAVTDWDVADPEAITGRGLGIVRRLADEVTVERDDDRFVVTARCSVRATSDA